jgi:hypothetical protein
MHPDLLAALADDRRRRCPCGAVTEHSYSLCRKCHARVLWRRKTTRTSRRTSRHLAARQARAGARRFAHAMSLLNPGSRGGEN